MEPKGLQPSSRCSPSWMKPTKLFIWERGSIVRERDLTVACKQDTVFTLQQTCLPQAFLQRGLCCCSVALCLPTTLEQPCHYSWAFSGSSRFAIVETYIAPVGPFPLHTLSVLSWSRGFSPVDKMSCPFGNPAVVTLCCNTRYFPPV